MWNHAEDWIDWAFEDAARLPATRISKRTRAKVRDFNALGLRVRGISYFERSSNPLRRVQRALMWIGRATEIDGHAAMLMAYDMDRAGRHDERWRTLKLQAYRKKHRPRSDVPRKLTMLQAKEIRSRHESGESMRSLAKAFGVSAPMIGLVVRQCVYRDAPRFVGRGTFHASAVPTDVSAVL